MAGLPNLCKLSLLVENTDSTALTLNNTARARENAQHHTFFFGTPKRALDRASDDENNGIVKAEPTELYKKIMLILGDTHRYTTVKMKRIVWNLQMECAEQNKPESQQPTEVNRNDVDDYENKRITSFNNFALEVTRALRSAFTDSAASIMLLRNDGIWKSPEKRQQTPYVNAVTLQSVAQLACESYKKGSGVGDVGAVLETLFSAQPHESIKEIPHESIKEIHVTFYKSHTERTSRITVTKPIGLFTENSNWKGDYQFPQHQAEIPTIRYERASFSVYVPDDDTSEGVPVLVKSSDSVGETIETFPFYEITTESLQRLATKASSVYHTCSIATFKSALWQMLVSAQATSPSDGTTMKQTEGDVLRLTNKTMTRHTVRLNEETNFCVAVTFTHRPVGSSKEKIPDIYVKEVSLDAIDTGYWNRALYFYLAGDQKIGSDRIVDYNEVLRRKGFSPGLRHVLELEVTYHEKNTISDTQAFYDESASVLLLTAWYDWTNSNQGESLQFKKLGVGLLEHQGDQDKCVSVCVNETKKTLKINSLFHALSTAERAGCNVFMSDDLTPTKKGAGALILKVMTDIAAKLGFERINLVDAATFVQIETLPYFGKIGITAYLRALRGYGYYEAYGFFLEMNEAYGFIWDDVIEEQQSTLYFNHHLYTTKIGELKTAFEEHTFWKKPGLIKFVNRHEKEELDELTAGLKGYICQFDAKYDEWSMRHILETFINLVKLHRPETSNAFGLDHFTKMWKMMYHKKKKVEDKKLQHFSDIEEMAFLISTLDNRIVYIGQLTSTKYILLFHQMVVKPNEEKGKVPMVLVEEVDYEFRVGQGMMTPQPVTYPLYRASDSNQMKKNGRVYEI